MMKNEEIKQLLSRYYQGETTIDEERRLREYFLHNDVVPEWQADKELFLRMADVDSISVPEGLGQRLSDHIDRWEAEEQCPERSAKPSARRFLIRRPLWGITATLLLLAGIGLYFQEAKYTPRDTFDNPASAQAEAERALRLFASALNKGQQSMQKAEEAAQKLQDQINNLQNPKK